MINEKALEKIKPGAFLINTARGKLVDTKAVLHALDSGTLGAYGADVYEQESTFFYQTFRSLDEIDDAVLRSLVSHPHALITSHQAFLTQEAMRQMASTLIKELTYYEGLGSGLADRLMI
jgi:D-lactate dehydrogenase